MITEILLSAVLLSASENVITAKGELKATDTAIVSIPRLPRTWNVTIGYLAPEGRPVQQGMPVVKFDTKQIEERLRSKSAELDQQKKSTDQERIQQQESIEDLQLEIERIRGELDKAKLLAELPAEILDANQYRENQLDYKLKQRQLEFAQKRLQQTRDLHAAQREISQARVQTLENDVGVLADGVKKGTVMAARSGVFLHHRKGDGERIEVGDNLWIGFTIGEIPSLDSLVLRLQVPERDLQPLDVGDTVNFRLEAQPEKVYTARVARIGSVVRQRSPDQPSMIIDVDAVPDALDTEVMRPGMRVSAEIFTDEI